MILKSHIWWLPVQLLVNASGNTVKSGPCAWNPVTCVGDLDLSPDRWLQHGSVLASVAHTRCLCLFFPLSLHLQINKHNTFLRSRNETVKLISIIYWIYLKAFPMFNPTELIIYCFVVNLWKTIRVIHLECIFLSVATFWVPLSRLWLALLKS